MSVTLTGPEGWFTRQGKIIGAFNRVAGIYGSTITNDFQAIWSEFVNNDQGAIVALPASLNTFRSNGQTYLNSIATAGSAASILQVHRDRPLSPYSFEESIRELARQMKAASQSINRPTVTMTVTSDTNNLGNSKVFISNRNIYGDTLDMIYSEKIRLRCVSSEGGTSFGSVFRVVGEPGVSPVLYEWPKGSGIDTTINTFDPAVSTLISNGNFTQFLPTNNPISWTIINGNPGTTVFESTNGGRRTGTKAVYLESDGSSNTQLAQDVPLVFNSVYVVTLQARIDTLSSSGNLTIRLTDSSGTVLQNDAGSDLSTTIGLNGGTGEVTTTYRMFTVFYSTPRRLPPTTQLRIGFGTAPPAGRQLYLSLVGITVPLPLYGARGTGTSGPFLTIIADTSASAINDSYDIDITNSLGTQSFVRGLHRLYNLLDIGVYLPSSTSPTISDSLVTAP